jgi:hypothetical protein
MPLPPSVIASIVSAILDMTVQVTDRAPQYQDYVRLQKLPPEAQVGLMQPISGDGMIVIGDKRLQLSPAIQIRNLQNMIVVPMNVTEATNVVYLNDMYGSVHRVWMITRDEAESLTETEQPDPSP